MYMHETLTLSNLRFYNRLFYKCTWTHPQAVKRESVVNQEQNGRSQWRSWWDGTFWAVSSGSTLFAKVCVLVYKAERVNQFFTLPMIMLITEPRREKTHLLISLLNEDLNQPAYLRSLIRIFVVRKKTLHPWLSKMCRVKILIRRHECADWSESSLGGHVRRYIYWRCVSNMFYFSTKTGLLVIPTTTEPTIQSVRIAWHSSVAVFGMTVGVRTNITSSVKLS